MFTFPLDPRDIFAERAMQMAAWGIPTPIIERVRLRVTDTWEDRAGGWSYEWTREAHDAERSRKWLLAAALHGAARFPCVCTPARKAALEKQVECYLAAAPSFPCAFERRTLDLNGARVPTHIFSRRGRHEGKSAPILVLSGGVDTYKMELHRLAVVLAVVGGLRVAAIDMPGTGETPGPLSPDADETYLGVLHALRSEATPDTKLGVLGISFGGLWAAKLAMRGVVDAAVDIGGPVGHAPMDVELLLRLPNGMTGIVANAMGFTDLPSNEEAGRLLSLYSLRARGLLDPSRATSAKLLAINGLGDPYISPDDTKVFTAFRNAEVWLTRDGDHCASNQLKRMAPAFIAWLRMNLHRETRSSRALFRMAKLVLPTLAEPT